MLFIYIISCNIHRKVHRNTQRINTVQRNQNVTDKQFTSNTAYITIKFHGTGSMLKIEDEKYTSLNANMCYTMPLNIWTMMEDTY